MINNYHCFLILNIFLLPLLCLLWIFNSLISQGLRGHPVHVLLIMNFTMYLIQIVLPVACLYCFERLFSQNWIYKGLEVIPPIFKAKSIENLQNQLIKYPVGLQDTQEKVDTVWHSKQRTKSVDFSWTTSPPLSCACTIIIRSYMYALVCLVYCA